MQRIETRLPQGPTRLQGTNGGQSRIVRTGYDTSVEDTSSPLTCLDNRFGNLVRGNTKFSNLSKSQYRAIGLAVGFAGIPVAVAGIFWWPMLLLGLVTVWFGVALASHGQSQTFEPETALRPPKSARPLDMLKLWNEPPPRVKILKAEVMMLPGLPEKVSLHVFIPPEGREDLTLDVSDILAENLFEELDLSKGSLGHFLVRDNQLLDFSFSGIPTPQDPEIMRVTGELCERLKITGVDTERIYWGESDSPCSLKPYMYYGRKGPYQLQLSESLAGKLQAGEWEPLIASVLVFQRKLWKNRVLRDLRSYFTFTCFILTVSFASGRRAVSYLIIPLDMYILLAIGLSFFGIIGASQLKKRTLLGQTERRQNYSGEKKHSRCSGRFKVCCRIPLKRDVGELLLDYSTLSPPSGKE